MVTNREKVLRAIQNGTLVIRPEVFIAKQQVTEHLTKIDEAQSKASAQLDASGILFRG
jgi:hypothetical protein